MNRGLVSIRAISAVLPHPNADLLEIALVDGWRVVVRKGMFIADDFAVFFQIGSLLPVKPEYEFLRKKCFVPGLGFRLKTVMVRGELSQGLLTPFTEELKSALEKRDIGWDTDLTKFFDVTEYRPSKYPMVQNIRKELLPTTEVEAVQKYCGQDVELSTKSSFTNWFYKLLGIKTTVLSGDVGSEDFEAFVLNLAEYIGKDVVVSATICGPYITNKYPGQYRPYITGNYHKLYRDVVIITNITVEGEQLPTFKRRDLVQVMQEKFGFEGRHALIQIPTGGVMALDNIALLLQISEYTLPTGRENVGLTWRTCDGTLTFVTMSNKYLLGED